MDENLRAEQPAHWPLEPQAVPAKPEVEAEF